MRRPLTLALAAGAALYLAARALRRRAKPIAESVVLITGARGLAIALARECARRGAIPVLCARNMDELERALLMLCENGTEAWCVAADVRDPSEAEQAVERVVSRYGRIDAVINNAGIICVGPLSTMQRSDYEDALATHFWGAYNVVQAALPHFRAQGGGRIANVSSVGGRLGVPHLLPYAVSKFALAGYSEGLYAELASEGIAVTTVYPGLMRTGSPRNARFRGNARAEYAWFKLADTAPGISVTARQAARAIVTAMERREPTLTISPAARLGSFAHGIAPSTTLRVLALAARFLPKATQERSEAHAGKDLETPLTGSLLTALGRSAEYAYNER